MILYAYHEHRVSKKLAALLGEIAGEIAASDGDFVAQTAIYALFIQAWTGRRAGFDDLIDSTTCGKAIAQARCALASLDLRAVFSGYLAEGKDPAIYFYEDFLRAYDAKTSRRRGRSLHPTARRSDICSGAWRRSCGSSSAIRRIRP